MCYFLTIRFRKRNITWLIYFYSKLNSVHVKTCRSILFYAEFFFEKCDMFDTIFEDAEFSACGMKKQIGFDIIKNFSATSKTLFCPGKISICLCANKTKSTLSYCFHSLLLYIFILIFLHKFRKHKNGIFPGVLHFLKRRQNMIFSKYIMDMNSFINLIRVQKQATNIHL